MRSLPMSCQITAIASGVWYYMQLAHIIYHHRHFIGWMALCAACPFHVSQLQGDTRTARAIGMHGARNDQIPLVAKLVPEARLGSGRLGFQDRTHRMKEREDWECFIFGYNVF